MTSVATLDRFFVDMRVSVSLNALPDRAIRAAQTSFDQDCRYCAGHS